MNSPAMVNPHIKIQIAVAEGEVPIEVGLHTP
jgi:hypothetical protein